MLLHVHLTEGFACKRCDLDELSIAFLKKNHTPEKHLIQKYWMIHSLGHVTFDNHLARIENAAVKSQNIQVLCQFPKLTTVNTVNAQHVIKDSSTCTSHLQGKLASLSVKIDRWETKYKTFISVSISYCGFTMGMIN
jgi:hypothetical protein